MDDRTILIELDAVAVRNLHALMAKFNVHRIDEMIATAVSVMNELQDFVQDGVVTLIDPRAPTDDPADREVELVFETLRNDTPPRAMVTPGH